MTFEFVKKEGRQRFYKSDVAIKKFPNKNFHWDKELANSKSRLKKGIKLLDDECFYICVSDAHTHIERLVFVAGQYEMPDGTIDVCVYSFLDIDGIATWMTNGGDPKAVKPDEVYLRRIKMVNR